MVVTLIFLAVLIGGMVISFIFFHIQPTDKAVNHAVAALVKALNPRL